MGGELLSGGKNCGTGENNCEGGGIDNGHQGILLLLSWLTIEIYSRVIRINRYKIDHGASW